ncbi:MAG: ecotin [Sphingobacterium composti]|uniref:ecotin n=1 Tax=Sphingobacterium composti TaxID=363260 RepID=UPI00135C13C7|nr:ecotin family protein [Sphingobacterium composti Ten et al. 2007 non Yoo et al. 2007]
MKQNRIKFLGLLVAFITFTVQVMAQQVITKQDLSIFPKPEAGYKKVVIEVPHSDKDNKKKIEFSVGKWMEVDGCNFFNLQGTLETKDLQGWGYNYYVFKTNGQVTSTMMGCPDAEKRNLFVTAQPEIVRYNGKLPIVIYVPEGYDVQFKIYKAEEDTYWAAEEISK